MFRLVFTVKLLLVSVLLPGCQNTSAVANAGPGDAPALTAETADAVIAVRGLSCPLCAENIQRQFGFDPRVVASQIDLGTGQVYLDFAAGQRVSEEDLAETIDTAGFTPGRVVYPAGEAVSP